MNDPLKGEFGDKSDDFGDLTQTKEWLQILITQPSKVASGLALIKSASTGTQILTTDEAFKDLSSLALLDENGNVQPHVKKAMTEMDFAGSLESHGESEEFIRLKDFVGDQRNRHGGIRNE